MHCSTPGFPVHHQLLELAQTHADRVGDAIQPSHPLSSISPPAFNLSQHRGLFQCQFFTPGSQSVGISASASVLPISAYCMISAYCIIMTKEKEWCQDKTEDLYLTFQRKDMNHSENCHHVKFQSAVVNQWLVMLLKKKQ